MKTITEVVLNQIEETKKKFYERYGKNCKDEKKLFINWYVKNHDAPMNVLINDLSQYYLYISEASIILYLNEPET